MTRRKVLFYALFFFSGAAGLGYQLVWAKIFALGLGHELPAVLAVICAFMAGMALGSSLLDRPLVRRPNRSYALLELVIAVWGAATAFLLGPVNGLALRLIGLDSPFRQWAVSFAVPLLILLPATVCLGATFPAMERCLAALLKTGRAVPGIYAINTFGAVVGTLGSTFVLAPHFGYKETLLVLAAINSLCALGAFLLTIPDPSARNQFVGTPKQPRSPRLIVALSVSGFLGIGFEVVGVRVLSQVLANTVYTYAAVLSVFLLGTAGGAAVYARIARTGSPVWTRLLPGTVALACLGGIFLLKQSQEIYAYFRDHFGSGMFSALVSDVAVATLVFGLPTLLMGGLFTHLVQSWRDTHGRIGHAAALNTAGAAVAPLVFSVLLLPVLGSKWSLALIAFGYLFLLSSLKASECVVICLSFGLLFITPANLHLIELPPKGSLLDYREGVMASAAVVQDATRNRSLRVNNHFQMGGTGATEAEYRHAHIPLLLHPAPTRALVLGLGTGITLGAASRHPNLKTDGVELLPEVLALMPQFAPQNYAPEGSPTIQLHIADARRFVKVSDSQYDVIIADLFHPAQDGAGALYTLEHFQAIRARLAPGGLFCQWLPLHQLDEDMLKVIIRTFLEVFPNAQAYLLRFNVDAPVLGLIGFTGEQSFTENWIEKRIAGGTLESEIKKLALADSIRFFGNLLAGSTDLARFSAGAPLNRDDDPVVVFRAPRFAYQTASPYGRLLTLLDQLHPDPVEALHLRQSDGAFAQKLRDYFAARSAYIHGLIAESENNSNQAVDAFVESARLSTDFTPGYAQCLTLASLEVRTNPAKARQLLERLVAAQPSRPVAQQMIDRLFPTNP